MSQFDKWLRDQLEHLGGEALKEPSVLPKEGDIVIGSLQDIKTRMLFGLRTHLDVEAAKAVEEGEVLSLEIMLDVRKLGPKFDLATCPRCRRLREIRRFEERAGIVASLLWDAVQAEIPEEKLHLLEQGQPYLCKGWMIAVPSTPQQEILSFRKTVTTLMSKYFQE